MEDSDAGDVGGTGREGSMVPPSWRHFHESDKNENIGSKNDHQGAYFIESG